MSTPEAAIWLAPGRCGGEPCLLGTRLTTRMIANLWWSATYTGLAELADAYDLTRGQVLVALWYQAVHGAHPWRQRWGRWARLYASALAGGADDTVPGPSPRRAVRR